MTFLRLLKRRFIKNEDKERNYEFYRNEKLNIDNRLNERQVEERLERRSDSRLAKLMRKYKAVGRLKRRTFGVGTRSI